MLCVGVDYSVVVVIEFCTVNVVLCVGVDYSVVVVVILSSVWSVGVY